MLLESLRMGIEKYQPIDLKLLPDEKVVKVLGMSALSKFRTYVVGLLVALLGYQLYVLTGAEEITVVTLLPLLGTVVVTYLVWHTRVTQSAKRLLFDLIKYAFYIVMFSYFITFLTSYLGPILDTLKRLVPFLTEAVEGLPTDGLPRFSLNPIENIQNILNFFLSIVATIIVDYAFWISIAGMAIIMIGLVSIPLVFLEAKGHIYYLTDRRMIIRRKFGTVQVTTLPLDAVVEVTSFQGFLGRIFGYGDVVVSMTSGGGVTESLMPRSVSPVGSFYLVKRRFEGIKNPWEMKDMIMSLRDSYVEAHYLKRIEQELKKLTGLAVKEEGVKGLLKKGAEEKREEG